MKEIQDIVRAYDIAVQQGKQTALATVVHVEGSSYRRPGARMLVREDGELTGAISGGCLEGDALRKAQQVMLQQHPMLVTYDTTDEDDARLGVGLGCNGIIRVLIEPIVPEHAHHPLLLLKAFLARRQKAVLVTLFSLHRKAGEQPGTCMLLNAEEKLSPLTGNSLLQATDADAHQALLSGIPLIKGYASPVMFTALIDVLKPSVSLWVFGAGNDAIPLAQMAAILGWQVTVTDGRPAYATAARFPSARQVLVSKPDAVLSTLSWDAQTVAVLMTHNFNYDLAMLRQLLPLGLAYIGVLGPKKKLHRLLQALAEAGMEVSEAQLQHLYGPAGLDIGAETPDEIALSIISEMKAVMAKKGGTPLREKPDAIHSGTA